MGIELVGERVGAWVGIEKVGSTVGVEVVGRVVGDRHRGIELVLTRSVMSLLTVVALPVAAGGCGQAPLVASHGPCRQV